MSHTTTINGINFVDINALRGAVEELKQQGVRCFLDTDTTPRAYYSQQAGMEQAPYVLKLEDSRYDVGFYKNGQGYEARTDFWGGDVENVLGNKPLEGENPDQAKMGKLYQAYALTAIERQAAMEGRTTQRIRKDDGTVQLVVSA